MHTTIKKLGVSILCAGLMLPSVAGATTATSTEALMAQIKALQTQIAGLQEQAKTLKTQTATLQQTQNELIHSLKMTMKEGMSGDDIKALQALLAADPSIYPEGKITGYYGPMTTKAVKRFQEKHGFEKVGFVGKKTLGKLNELMQDNPMRFEHATSTAKSEDENENDKEKKLCAIIPPGHEIAKGWVKNNEKPLVPTCQTLPKGIER
jgi:peptidoglycan hydrolase-like protein with peptidoglycan-binding domain